MQPGTRLGHYTILSGIDRGGMGEVWKARDAKLGREVAIKTLPEELAHDVDRLSRFEQEARLLASLNHPNIASIHGFDEDGGTHFLVMELVEGETLADRLRPGTIPVRESLEIAVQIAKALEAAHERGVLHRDVKPANIKITPNGQVKVLDFGLAKTFTKGGGDSAPSNEQTISLQATETGVIVGTAPYMSPEQASGQVVDHRSDIWAFGVVLFEMLSGKWVFNGASVPYVLASVLKNEPEWDHLPADLQPRIRFLLERCLEKDPKDRCQGIGEVRAELEKILADRSIGVVAASVPGSPAGTAVSKPLMILGLLIAALLVATIGAAWFSRSEDERPVTSLVHHLPEGQSFNNLNTPALAVSPLDDSVVYAAGGALYLRAMDEIEPRLIQGTEADRPESPIFSPDGEWIAYWSSADGELKRIAVRGGGPVPIAPSSNPRGPTWSEDDMLLYSQGAVIWQVPAFGGEPEQLVGEEGGAKYEPTMLPGGEHLMYVRRPTADAASDEIVVRSLNTRNETRLFPGARPQYLETGHLLYLEGGTNLVLRRFDAATLDYGSAVTLAERALGLSEASAPQYAVSPSGTLVFIPASLTGGVPLGFVEPGGAVDVIEAIRPRDYQFPAVSPDGTQVAVQATEGDRTAIFVYELSGDSEMRLLTLDGNNYHPAWTFDSEWITYASDRDGPTRIWRQRADGTGVPEPLTTPLEGEIHTFPAWAPDGRLSYLVSGGATVVDGDTLIVDVPDGTPELLVGGPDGQGAVQFSPDGSTFAYIGGASGRFRIWVEPFPPGESSPRLVSEGAFGDGWPVWSRDENRLYYHANAGVYYVAVDTSAGLAIRDRSLIPAVPVIDFRRFDTIPNNSRLLAVLPFFADSNVPSQIRIVRNWIEQVRQRTLDP